MITPVRDLYQFARRLEKTPEKHLSAFDELLRTDFMVASFVRAYLGVDNAPTFEMKGEWTYTWSIDPQTGIVSLRHNITISKPGTTYVFPANKAHQFYGWLFQWMATEPLYTHPEWSSRPEEWRASITWNLFVDKANALFPAGLYKNAL